MHVVHSGVRTFSKYQCPSETHSVMHVCPCFTWGTCGTCGSGGTHSGLPGGEQPLLRVMLPSFCLAAHCVFKTDRLFFFHFVLVALKKDKSRGAFYSIYEKERVMSLAQWSIIYE